MEDIHGSHKEQALGVLIGAVARTKRQSVEGLRGFVVTSWIGRSPGGWSA